MRTPATASAALLQKNKPQRNTIRISHPPDFRKEKTLWITFLLCLFCGGLGVHRYYVGKIGTGILYTLTAGLFGIGYLVDFIKILCGKFTDKNGNLIQREKK